ncbi:hypothetical protein [Namhaeicola litoreus]|uniref:Uncharacterized protein n=1 Tax=Namhaeicola litoreus TaxID=1052145 RepID=A0ABW3XYT9_9FLAO
MIKLIKNWSLGISFLMVFLLSCSSPQKMLDQGNYYQAVIMSVEKLKSNPNNEKAKATLKASYPYAVNDFIDKLEKEGVLNSQFRNTNQLYLYGQLNDLYEKIAQSPAAMNSVENPKKYYTEYNRLLPLAAEEQYAEGERLLSLGGRDNAKAAYGFYEKADQFVPGYKNVNEQLNLSFELALLKVYTIFEPIQSRTYELSAETFYQQVKNTLQRIEQERFVRFVYNEGNTNGPQQEINQNLVIRFEDFVVGETHTREKIEEVSRDSVKIGETKLDNGRTKEVYGTVAAELTNFHIEVSSRGLVHLNIEDLDVNRNLVNEDLPGQYVWFHDWATYQGDKRALNDLQWNLCQNRYAQPIPPQQMFVEFTKPIYAQVDDRLRRFYANY